ncbi:M48 family metallopeptidase [Flaviaesturariibacter amylovorans]|uniref:Metalloprotease LoiP n=1 Tax=Flaviaesturariibacter amylovorans TaxID=1084520 RepID=A0ABP8HJC0_9BACT
MARILSIFLLLLLAACNQIDRAIGNDDSKRKDATNYSYACLDSSLAGNRTGRTIERATNVIRDLAVSKKTITDSLETTYGEAFHRDMLAEGGMKLIGDAALDTRLNTALHRLLEQRTDPSGIRYVAYAVEDTVVNAFTFGGRIYITRGMLNRVAQDEALLYAIIGHEVGHSEAGHIKATIQDMALSEKLFGNNGTTFFELKRLLTASFNQKNELEADYYGINLTNRLGFDLCTVVTFWKEMASRENPYNKVEDFFRTHPFSDARAECLAGHIRTNFGKDCGALNKGASLPQVTR